MNMIKTFDLKIIDQKMESNCNMILEYPISKKTEITSFLSKYLNIENKFKD